MKEYACQEPHPVDKLIDDIYGASEDAALWTHVLEGIDSITGALCSCVLAMTDIRGKTTLNNIASNGYSEPLSGYQSELMATDNIPGIVKRLGTGKIIDSMKLLGSSGARASTVYHDFYAKCGFLHFLGINFVLTDDVWLGLVSFGGPALFPGDDQNSQFFQRIAPHVRRSLGLTQMPLPQPAISEATLHLLDDLHHSAFLLNCDRKIIGMNNQARELLAKGLVQLDPEGALVTECEDHQRMGKFACTHGERPGQARSNALSRVDSLQNETRLLTFNLRAPLWPGLSLPAQNACTLAVVLNHDTQIASVAMHVRAKFGLTSAEFRIYNAAITHATTSHIATSLCLSRETVRSHLKSIYSKIGVSSHVELLQNFALH
jgi:DNA-binding CsgD family transcriptional regulator